MPATLQLDLFNLPVPSAEPVRKLELPFQMSQTIDAVRTRSILDVSHRTMTLLLDTGEIRGYHAPGKPKHWRIEYDSVVEYCDKLRVHYHISDTRAPRKTGRHNRRRDSELLPFPKDETTSVSEVAKVLSVCSTSVVSLIQDGTLTAYQIVIDQRGCPWRIWEPSFERYLITLHEVANRTATSKKRTGTK